MSRLLQFLIALVGLGITVMLGLASMKNEEVQTKQSLLALFSNSVSVARNNCDAGLLFIAEDAVRELSNIDAAAAKVYGERLEEVDATIRGPACTAATSAAAAQIVAGAPEVLTAPPPPAADAEARERAVVQAPAARAVQAEVQEQAKQVAITNQMASRSQNLEFRKVQSKIAPLDGGGRYYAVLASYGVGDGATYDEKLGAAAHYNQLVSAASKTKAVVEVFRTKQSNHFAIVLRPDPPTRDGARELSLLARREGWATDSFVQVEREWVQCKDPSSNDGLRACAK